MKLPALSEQYRGRDDEAEIIVLDLLSQCKERNKERAIHPCVAVCLVAPAGLRGGLRRPQLGRRGALPVPGRVYMQRAH